MSLIADDLENHRDLCIVERIFECSLTFATPAKHTPSFTCFANLYILWPIVEALSRNNHRQRLSNCLGFPCWGIVSVSAVSP